MMMCKIDYAAMLTSLETMSLMNAINCQNILGKSLMHFRLMWQESSFGRSRCRHSVKMRDVE